MPSAVDHGHTVLAAIIPARRDLLDKALRHIQPDYFVDPLQRNIFTMLERYYEVTGAVLSRAALADILGRSRADAGKVLAYGETYDLLAQSTVDDADFGWSLEQLRELAADRATGTALTQAMEILTRGAQNDKGELLRGHAEARAHVLRAIADIDRDLSIHDAPEGDMRDEADDILADYAARKAARAAGTSVGIEFGIPSLDARTGGINRGDLVLAAAYTSEGKTSLMVQLAWNAIVNQGRNVVVLTTETVRDQVRRRLIARHSCLEPFGCGGLNSRDIKEGRLSADQEHALSRVVADFSHNPGYGCAYIAQVPRAATMSYVESKLLRIQHTMPIDLVIMDYLALLRPDRRRQSEREELVGILKEAKQLTTSFNDGAGVPLVSPWQVGRLARAEAERVGYYSSSAITAETAEASNSPDLIVSLLAPLDSESRVVSLKMQILKARDAEKVSPLDVSVDYATSRFFVPSARSDGGNTLFADFGL